MYVCMSLLSRLPYEEIARDRILHSRIMEVQVALRCTGVARRGGSGRVSTKESGSSPVFRVPRSFFAGLGCQNERAEICTWTSVQVAIGLFPIDSVRGEFLLLSLLFFAYCLHLPFTCTSRSFFRVTPPVAPLPPPPPHIIPFPFLLLLTHLYRVPALFLPFLFPSSAFCNLDTEKIKETLLY